MQTATTERIQAEEKHQDPAGAIRREDRQEHPEGAAEEENLLMTIQRLQLAVCC